MKSLVVYKSLVPSKISNIKIVVEDLICNLEQCCGELDDCTLFELKVILNELLVNAIRHGNMDDENKNVKIVASIVEHRNLFVIVEDEGSGYDYNHACDNLKPFCNGLEPSDVSDCSECGRGILIVKRLCESVQVNTRGNRTAILKRISKASPKTD